MRKCSGPWPHSHRRLASASPTSSACTAGRLRPIAEAHLRRFYRRSDIVLVASSLTRLPWLTEALLGLIVSIRSTSPTRGREQNVHFCDYDKGFIGLISHLGIMIEVMSGVALTFKLRKQPRVALVYSGDGASSTGAFHEGFNFAAVQRAPLVGGEGTATETQPAR